MVEALKNIRREVDALSEAILAESGAFLTNNQLLERIAELFFGWLSNLKPLLVAGPVPAEVIARADRALSEVMKLTGRRSRREDYRTRLRAFRLVLMDQILPEVLNLPIAVPATSTRQPLLAEIPGLTDELVPHSLLGWVTQLREFLATHAFDHNVFIMVAYRTRLKTLIDRLKGDLLALGLNGIVARDHRITDDLNNPIACLLCCNYGVAVFDRAEARQMHNPNVVYELGMMQLLKRPCVILKNRKLKIMPTDLLSRLYEDYATVDEASTKLHGWWNAISA